MRRVVVSAGANSGDLRPIWLPQVVAISRENLRSRCIAINSWRILAQQMVANPLRRLHPFLLMLSLKSGRARSCCSFQMSFHGPSCEVTIKMHRFEYDAIPLGQVGFSNSRTLKGSQPVRIFLGPCGHAIARNAPGVIPVRSLKTRVKWLWSA